MRKDRRMPAPKDLPRLFDDKCIRQLVRIDSRLRSANIQVFAAGVLKAAELFVRDASAATHNEVHYEVDGLLRAAERAVKARKRKDVAYEDVAVLIERLSERTRTLLNDRGFGTLPEPETLRDPATQCAVCKTVARLCRIGACRQEGRRRPGGKRSMTLVPVLHAPPLEQHPARREAQLYFVMMLRAAYLEATAKRPPATSNPGRPSPFAKIAQVCLDKLQAGANADELLKELQRRRKDREKRQQRLSCQNP
jgi:hypothetical protein